MPTAWASSAATTEESTPPESPQITRPSPTRLADLPRCSRGRNRPASTSRRNGTPRGENSPGSSSPAACGSPRDEIADRRSASCGASPRHRDRCRWPPAAGNRRPRSVTWSPWLIHTWIFGGRPANSSLGAGDQPALGPAVFAGRRACDAAAQGLALQLHAVADAQHGDAQAEDGRVALAAPRLVDARRPAGEDQSPRPDLADPLGRDVVADDFAVDLLLRGPAGRSTAHIASRNPAPESSVPLPWSCPASLKESRIIEPPAAMGQWGVSEPRGLSPRFRGGASGLATRTPRPPALLRAPPCTR